MGANLINSARHEHPAIVLKNAIVFAIRSHEGATLQISLKTTLNIIATATVFGLWTPAWSTEPLKLTLEQVMARALERPVAVAASQRAMAAEADAQTIKNEGRLPTVAGQGNLTWNDEVVELETPQGVFRLGDEISTSINASITQPIFDPARQFYGAPAAKYNAQSLKETAHRTNEQLSAFAAEVFYQVLSYDAQLRATNAFIESLSKRLEETKARVELGRTLEADALKVQLDLDQANQDKFAIENARRVAVRRLGLAIGYDGSVEPVFDWESPLPPIPSREEAGKLNQRSDILSLETGLQSAEYGKKAIKAEYIPRVEAVATYSWADGDPFREGSFLQGGLQVSWRPFAGGTRKPRLAAAQYRIEALKQDLEETRRSAQIELDDAFASLDTARGALKVAESGVALATETVRVERERSDNGRSTVNDLLDAEAALRRQKTNLELAKIGIRRALIQLDLARGAIKN